MLKKLFVICFLFVATFALTSVNIVFDAHARSLTIEEVQERTAGLWRYQENGEKHFYYFGSESVNMPHITGGMLELDENSNIIMQLSHLSSQGTLYTQAYKIIDLKRNTIVLQNDEGKKMRLKRANRDILGVTGSLFYRERIALPELVDVHVKLFMENQKQEKRLVASSVFTAQGAIPIPFSLYFIGAMNRVAERAFTLEASISSNGEKLFEVSEPLRVTENYIFVSTQGPKPQHDRPSHKDEKKDGGNREANRGEMREGMRPPHADVHHNRPEKQQRPEGSKQNVRTSAPSLEVLLHQVADMQQNSSEKSATDKIHTFDESLTNTYWRLISMNGKDVQVFENMPEPHLVLKDAQGFGSDGCNRFTLSRAEANPQDFSLVFGEGASTMMLCHEGEEQAMEFVQSLRKIENYEIQGSKLILKSNDKAKLIFEARAL